MSPSHSTKGNRRSRYYVSQAILLFREKEAGSVQRGRAQPVKATLYLYERKDGVLKLKYRTRIYYTDEQKAEMWNRWQRGETNPTRLATANCGFHISSKRISRTDPSGYAR